MMACGTSSSPKALIRLALSLLFCLVAAPASGDKAQPKKFFIRIEVPPAFPTLPDQILALAEENLPVQILKRRGFVYDNPQAYLDSKHWNPSQSYRLHDSGEILERLGQLRMELMISLSLSPVVGSGGSLLLTGQLMDLSIMDRLLQSCLDSIPPAADCPRDFSAFHAVSVASVMLPSFSSFPKALKSLFAKLLHIPEVTLDDTAPIRPLYRPGGDISFGLWIDSNQGPPGTIDSPEQDTAVLPKITYSVAALSMPPEAGKAFCRAPDQYWDQLVCDSDPKKNCRHKYLALAVKRMSPRFIDSPQYLEGRRLMALGVKLDDPEDSADVIVRAAVSIKESLRAAECTEKRAPHCQIEVTSEPIYQCFKYRDSKHYVGLSFSLSGLAHGITKHTPSEYEVDYSYEPITPLGVNLRYGYRKERVYLSAELGYVRSTIYSSCSDVAMDTGRPWVCSVPGYVHRLSGVDTRLAVQFEFVSFRLPLPLLSSGARLLGGVEAGLSAQGLRSQPSYLADGWLGTFHAGVGIKLIVGNLAHTVLPYVATTYSLNFLLNKQPDVSDSGMVISGSRPGLPHYSGNLAVAIGVDIGVN